MSTNKRRMRISQSMPEIQAATWLTNTTAAISCNDTSSFNESDSSWDNDTDSLEMVPPQINMLACPVLNDMNMNVPACTGTKPRKVPRREKKRQLIESQLPLPMVTLETITKKGQRDLSKCINRLTSRSLLTGLSVVVGCWIICTGVVLSSIASGFSDADIPLWPDLATNNNATIATSVSSVGTFSNIPVPLPTKNVSVVLINYSRPRMIRDSILMKTLVSHPNIDEILLLHANSKTAFEFVHPKVVNINAIQHNDEIGLSLRFYFCQLAKNEWVIHVDDDMEFSASTLNALLIEYSRNPKRIVGRFGRDLKPNNYFNGYSSTNTHKSTEVVLTKLMVMEQDVCSSFFKYSSVIWDELVLKSGEGPLWNGEDIFMSLVANHVYEKSHVTDTPRRNNYAMDWLDVWDAPGELKDYNNGKLDISGGMEGYRIWDWHWYQQIWRRNRHYSYRGTLWQMARNRLSELTQMERAE